MRRAKNRFERVNQVLRWLEAEYPCGRKIDLKWKKTLSGGGKSWHADTDRNGRVLHIRLSKRRNREWGVAIDTLLHEYAHAILWGVAGQETDDVSKHHPPAFWAQYGELADRWNHQGGDEEADEYGFQ